MLDMRSPRAIRLAVLGATLEHIDGRGDGSHWFPQKFLTHFGVTIDDDTYRLMRREIAYLHETGKLKAIEGADTYAVTGITAFGRDDLESIQP
jgi:hypothetical protein